MTNLTLIILALIAVESGGDPDAVNGDCVGVLQLRPVYVQDANRILGKPVFKPADRRSRVKSIRMARIVLGHYAKPEWTLREYFLCHKKGYKGMRDALTEEDSDYVTRSVAIYWELTEENKYH